MDGPRARDTNLSLLLFKDGAWSKVEDRISLEEIPNNTAKLEGKVVVSLTSVEKSREDPADTLDIDLEDPELSAPPEGESRDLRGEVKLREEATSPKHLFTHRPKNPFCPVCQKAKMLAPRARKKGFRDHRFEDVRGPCYHGSHHHPRLEGSRS